MSELTEKGKAWKKRVTNEKYRDGYDRIFSKKKENHDWGCDIAKECLSKEIHCDDSLIKSKCTCGYDDQEKK